MTDQADTKLYLPGGLRLMPSRSNPHCALCKEGITPDKRLYSCVDCHRYYHPGCYGRTLPGKPIHSPDWSCKWCLKKRTQRVGSANYTRTPRSSYHDSGSTSSYGRNTKSSTPVGFETIATAMSSRLSDSQTSRSTESGSLSLKECARDGCKRKVFGINRTVCGNHHYDPNESSQGNVKTTASAAGDGHRKETAADKGSVQTTGNLPSHPGANTLAKGVIRKTASSSRVIRPESFYSNTNGSTTPAQKRTQDARSPPDHSGGNGPARKKPRLGPEPEVESASKPHAPMRKPWDTGFNPRPTSKVPGHAPSGPQSQKGAEAKVKGKLPTSRTMRKFAPRIDLWNKGPSERENEEEDRSVSGSPHANRTARPASRSTVSPSQGKEFLGNDKLNRFWDQRQQRESANPEQRRGTPGTDGNSGSVLRHRAPSEINGPGASSSPLIEERKYSHLENRSFSSSVSERPPLPKQPSIPEEHLEGWKFIPPPAPKPQTRSDFDSLIYGQVGAAPPPRSVIVKKTLKPPPVPKPEPPDEPFYMHLDPRLHWPQPQTEEWRRKKLGEIEARGGRKANFGRAAQRMKEQQSKQPPKSFEGSLPEKIRNNEDWVEALRKIHEEDLQEMQEHIHKKRGGKRGPKPGRYGMKREVSAAGPSTPRKA